MTTVTLPAHHLRAALHLAGENDPRAHICSVLVELHPYAPYIIATDGVIIGVFRSYYGNTDAPPESVISINTPRDAIEKLPKGKFVDEVTIATADSDISLTCGSMSTTSKDAGEFPNWRRVLPPVDKIAPGVAVTLDPALITKAEKAVHTFLGLKPSVRAVPEALAVVNRFDTADDREPFGAYLRFNTPDATIFAMAFAPNNSNAPENPRSGLPADAHP